MATATLRVQSTQTAHSTADEAAVRAVIEALRNANHDKNAGLFAAQCSPAFDPSRVSIHFNRNVVAGQFRRRGAVIVGRLIRPVVLRF